MFPQAVPNKPVIDRKHCNYFVRGKCGVCEKFCEPGAIVMNDRDSVRELEVGTIIVATGYNLVNPGQFKQWGYGRFPDVYTGLEFERLCNAMGPTSGKIVKKDGQAPAAVGILHCIGSRDENYCKHCSRVCCMYSLKFAHLLREKTTARVYEFYIDMRAFGKGYEDSITGSARGRALRARQGRAGAGARRGRRRCARGLNNRRSRKRPRWASCWRPSRHDRPGHGHGPGPGGQAGVPRCCASRAARTASSPKSTPSWRPWKRPPTVCPWPAPVRAPRIFPDPWRRRRARLRQPCASWPAARS